MRLRPSARAERGGRKNVRSGRECRPSRSPDGRGVLFGARDRFGVKPLFVHRGKDCWLLASEVKAILASGLYVRETNWQVSADFLLDGKLDETPATFYAGIDQVPPGCAFELRLDGRWRQWAYWSLSAIEPEPTAGVEDAFAELLEDAVRIRLRSDVPVGVCLSGGLDSTAIICAMARNRQGARSEEHTSEL